ncbi:hypothetical protein DFH06DRAFT_1296068 [Mycena polygramma]|nr:hypothetical protein DFH06DRAFT_1296068 [Mycena polygramma]
MSFFAHSSVVIQGGTFYSAAGNVNIHNERQLTIEASEIDAELGQGGMPLALAWEGFSEDGPVSGPVSNTRARLEAGRLQPYPESAEPRQDRSRPSSHSQSPQDSEDPGVLLSFNTASDPNDYSTTGLNANQTSDTSQWPPVAYAPWTNTYPSHPEPATTIHNGTFINGNVNNTVRNGELGLDILHRASATEAFHDPADSHDQPRCHPETRIEIQTKLLNWCVNSTWPPAEWGKVSYDTEPTVLWLHGPAGAGKSAIMHTLSQRLEEEQRLGGAFFFKRGHATRGNSKALFVTLALQLAVNSDELKPWISGVAETNPTLVARSIGLQLQELILKPCSGMHGPPPTIIIDGLDECEGPHVQQEILRLILHYTQQTPLRFIIASRPEAHIGEVLGDPSYHGLCRTFDVESSFDDVRRYVMAEFARIHLEHASMADIPWPWPSQPVIDALVHKSSGYFIYASTVIKFVDDQDFRPTQRLAALEDWISSKSDSPYAALDELYTQILSAVPKHHHQLVPLLRAIDMIPGRFDLSEIDVVLRLEQRDTQLCLRRLHSVIRIDAHGCPTFFHASFSDFLRSPSRAGGFFTGNSPALMVAISLLTALTYKYEDPVRNRTRVLGFGARLVQAFESLMLRFEPSPKVFQLLSTVNLDVIPKDFSSGDRGLISWLKEHRSPEDLIRRWDDYAFSLSFATACSNPDAPVSAWQRVSGQVMEHAARNPLLLSICCGMLWGLIPSTSDRPLVLIRHLLNVSWDEVYATVCPLRSILQDSGLTGETRRFSELLIQNWMIGRPHWRASVCNRFAWGCLRVQNMIDTGRLPADLWDLGFPWGRVLRGTPACPELLCAVRKFVPRRANRTELGWFSAIQAEQCHNVIMWLGTFVERPATEIQRWETLFIKNWGGAREVWEILGRERHSDCEKDSRSQDPNINEARWRQWEEDYPECTE